MQVFRRSNTLRTAQGFNTPIEHVSNYFFEQLFKAEFVMHPAQLEARNQRQLSARTSWCYPFSMVRIPALVVLAAGLVLPVAGSADSSSEKVRSPRDFSHIQKEVETLRGKKFLREVPVYKVSAKQLRAISDREINRQFPGAELGHYEELLAWLDMVPPG